MAGSISSAPYIWNIGTDTGYLIRTSDFSSFTITQIVGVAITSTRIAAGNCKFNGPTSGNCLVLSTSTGYIYATDDFAVGASSLSQCVILTSTDPATWSCATLPLCRPLRSVAAGYNAAVAVGDNGTLLVDLGITGSWQLATTPTTAHLHAVAFAYSDSIPYFIVVGDAGVIITSQDGLNWDLSKSGTTVALRGIAADNPGAGSLSRVVAVGDQGTGLLADLLGDEIFLGNFE